DRYTNSAWREPTPGRQDGRWRRSKTGSDRNRNRCRKRTGIDAIYKVFSIRRRPIRSTDVFRDLACPFLRGNPGELRAGETNDEGRSEFGPEIRVISRLDPLRETGEIDIWPRRGPFLRLSHRDKQTFRPVACRDPPLTSPFQ